jgi:hypothetical protein
MKQTKKINEQTKTRASGTRKQQRQGKARQANTFDFLPNNVELLGRWFAWVSRQ